MKNSRKNLLYYCRIYLKVEHFKYFSFKANAYNNLFNTKLMQRASTIECGNMLL